MASKKSHVKNKIWLVGGGTGGHIVALLAVAEVLKSRQALKIQYVGDRNGLEYTLARQAGLPFLAVPSGKLRRYINLSAFLLNIRDSWRVIKGIFVSYRLIRREKPSVIFSKGGPVALPVALAAYLTRTPLATHESDAIMGLTNRLLARFARVVFTAFPAAYYSPRLASKISQVGVPIRKAFCGDSPKEYHKKRPMVLVTGGSQGAVAINEAVAQALPKLLPHASVMHITGAYSYSRYAAIKSELPRNLSDFYGVIDYTNDIASFMREADVVVSRASSTIFEIATLGKPMILIPLPTSANNHQQKNAEIFAHYHAAVMLLQENLTPDRLYETIMSVLEDVSFQSVLQKGTRTFYSCNSATIVAERLVALLKEDTA